MTAASYDVPRARWRVVPLVLAALLTGCGAPSSTSGSPGSPHPLPTHSHSPRTAKPHPSRPPTGRRTRRPARRPTRRPTAHSTPGAARVARAELHRLVVRPRPCGTEGYVRSSFGSDWVDTDHNGCNQRDDVLLRDAVPGSTRVQQQGSCNPDVLAGTWHDPYTDKTLHFTNLKNLHQAEAIQIDHVVPLAEAWVSGARRWSYHRRVAFANNLNELLAVDGPTNMSKGDGDPAVWRPRTGYQCTYALKWIAIKARWHLTIDPPEKAALDQMLGLCR
jgi:hypothetical protein